MPPRQNSWFPMLGRRTVRSRPLGRMVGKPDKCPTAFRFPRRISHQLISGRPRGGVDRVKMPQSGRPPLQEHAG